MGCLSLVGKQPKLPCQSLATFLQTTAASLGQEVARGDSGGEVIKLKVFIIL